MAIYPKNRIYDIAVLPAVSGRYVVRGVAAQAGQYGPTYVLAQEAQEHEVLDADQERRHIVATGDGTRIRCGAVIITGGIGTLTPRKLPAGEPFLERWLCYFAPYSTGYPGKDVIIVGGGDSATGCSVMLASIAASVTLVRRREQFRAHAATVEQVRRSGIRSITIPEVAELEGGSNVEKPWFRPRVVRRLRCRASASLPLWSSWQPRGHCASGASISTTTTTTSSSTRRCAPTSRASSLPVTSLTTMARCGLIAVGFGQIATAVNNASVHIAPGAQLFPGHSTEVPHDVAVPVDPSRPEGDEMPYVIASPCIDVMDRSCTEECPVDCIYEGDRKAYINPKECIDCGACEPVCPVDAISHDRRVPDKDRDHIDDNRRFFIELLDGRDAPLGAPGGAQSVGQLGVDTPLVAGS